ncbi:MAG: M56 family metallopeptidase [Planctomycetota bacterium]
MNSLTEALARTSIDAALQGALLLAVFCALARILRKRVSAATLHLVWGLGLVSLLFVWLPTPSVLRWKPVHGVGAEPSSGGVVRTSDAPARELAGAPVASAALAPEHEAIDAEVELEPTMFVASAAAPGDPTNDALAARTAAPRPTWTWHGVLVGVWLLGAALTFARYLLAIVGVLELVRGARPCSIALPPALADAVARHRVRLLESDDVRIPITAGALRPVVLVPADFGAWAPQRQRVALVHELEHVRRRDWLTRLVARVAVALHWFDPLAWLAERRMRLESERACDDAVLAHGDSSTDYASTLLDIARGLRATDASTPPSTAAIALVRGSHLEERMRSILDPDRRRGSVGSTGLALALGSTLAAAFAFGGLSIARALPIELSADEYTVAADGSAPFTSIQAAVDAAAEGATVRIAPGVYEEFVTIGKSLTLEGAGWDKARISVPYPDQEALSAKMQKELQEASTKGASQEELRALRERIVAENAPRPALSVKLTKDVVVRGLAFSVRGKGDEGAVLPGAAVEVTGSEIRVEDCAVIGAPCSGVVVNSASKFEMRHCLVAAVEATGIAIVGAEPEALISECEVRNCRHRGITVGGNATTTIERCRISGSAWHGIRYDGGAPRVVGNLILENERCGIYASGETRGEVRDNVFYGNGMTGISCWFQAGDTIEHNTFVGDQRSAIEVLGASKPAIHRNVFFGVDQAVYLGNVSGEGANTRTSGEVDLADNLFFEVERKAVVGQGTDDLPIASTNGNREADPKFVAPKDRDFRLAPDSPARAAGIGASEPLGFESAWPMQPEEQPQVAQRDVEAERAAGQKNTQEARILAKPWIDDLLQIDDMERRTKAVEEVRAALDSTDPVRRHAALMAFTSTGEVNYDRAPFVDVLRTLCATESGDAQVSAFYALNRAGRQPGDERILLEALKDPSPQLADSGLHFLTLYFDGKLEGEASDAALKLLPTDSAREARQRLSGMWGASASKEIQERLLELAQVPSIHHDIVYFALSTLQNKSREVVEYLIGLISSADHEDVWRSLWGLRQGVAASEHELVADAALKLFGARTDGQTRGDCLQLMEMYCSESHLAALRGLAENEMLSEQVRAVIRRTIERIEKN